VLKSYNKNYFYLLEEVKGVISSRFIENIKILLKKRIVVMSENIELLKILKYNIIGFYWNSFSKDKMKFLMKLITNKQKNDDLKFKKILKRQSLFQILKASASNKYKSQFYLVFEFCEHDLAGLLSTPTVKFSLGEQKKIMQQLLNGL
jgi:serine/threonine protein kinase